MSSCGWGVQPLFCDVRLKISGYSQEPLGRSQRDLLTRSLSDACFCTLGHFWLVAGIAFIFLWPLDTSLGSSSSFYCQANPIMTFVYVGSLSSWRQGCVAD